MIEIIARPIPDSHKNKYYCKECGDESPQHYENVMLVFTDTDGDEYPFAVVHIDFFNDNGDIYRRCYHHGEVVVFEMKPLRMGLGNYTEIEVAGLHDRLDAISNENARLNDLIAELASMVNSMACAILDDDRTEDTIDQANDYIMRVVPLFDGSVRAAK